jgi:hypothetical protein
MLRDPKIRLANFAFAPARLMASIVGTIEIALNTLERRQLGQI